MSKYTTGEIAKLCNVSVRTVQYYDSRGILIPSELTEGGRRLYNEENLNELKMICYLREIGLPISSIGQLLSEPNQEAVLSLLLAQQKEVLTAEIEEKKKTLTKLKELQQSLQSSSFSVESIGDIACTMKTKNKLRKLHMWMLIAGIPIDILQIGTLLYWIFKGFWHPFAISSCIAIVVGIIISYFYFKNTAYICPDCHTIFVPKFKNAFWAKHTPQTRKLTCTACGHNGFCVEVYRTEPNKNA